VAENEISGTCVAVPMCDTKCDTTDVCGPTMATTSSFSKFMAV
jgi:hypothetical protein